jgi:hypothetical protein
MRNSQDIFNTFAFIMQNPGMWHKWPLVYRNKEEAEKDMDALWCGKYCRLDDDQKRRFQWAPMHQTFLDVDGLYRVKIRYA